MDNLITVISLQGQAWAVAQDGSRRELRVGDAVAGDEMVVTADGARIDLQFANNQILTLIGEQDAPVDVAQIAEDAALSQPLTALNTEPEPLNAQFLENTVPKDGHGFVQLVRIGEIIEADGFTPLTVARIQEIIKPLGMALPERDFAQDRWKEHISRHEHHSAREYKVSIVIDVIADDDIINAAEAGRDIRVTGSVSGDVKPGDKVTVTVNGKTYDTTVNPDGKTWGVDIPGSELVQDKTVQATVTGSTPSGEPITADTERPYEVDTVPPEGSLINQEDKDADKISLDLGKEFNDDVSGTKLTYQAINLPEGLSIDPKTGVVSGDIDRSASQGGSDNDGKYTVTVIVTDEAGNSSEHDFVWAVTNPDPVATNDAQTIDEDTVATGNVITGINSTGTGGGKDSDPDGDPLVVTEFTVEGNTYSAGTTVTVSGIGDLTLNKNGDYTFTPLPDWNGTVPTVNYSISDGEDGIANADLIITVTPVNDPPEAVGTIDPKGDVDAVQITDLDTSTFFKDVDGDTLKYSAIGLPEGLSIDPNTGIISGTPDSSASQGGDKGKYNVTIIAEDPSGEKAEQAFEWTVINPEPVAVPDFGTTEKSIPLKVLAEDGVLENDTDEDEIRMLSVSNGTETVEPGNAIEGKYGTLVLQGDGSYTYVADLSKNEVRTLPANGELTDAFTYTITDDEGGTVTTTLTIDITGHSNTPPIIKAEDMNGSNIAGQLTVYEKGLSTGTEPQGGAHSTVGVINIAALDGLTSFTIGSGANAKTVTESEWLDLENNPIEFTDANGTLILTKFEPINEELQPGVIQVSGGALSYTYTLTEKQQHDVGEGANSTTIEIDLTVRDDQYDVNGNVEGEGKLTINVVDDVPLIAETNVEPALEVDETTLDDAGKATVNFSGVFAPNYGADGKSTTVPDEYSLLVIDGTDSGLVDTASGMAVLLYKHADGSIEGRVGDDTGAVAFKVSVNADGEVTLIQSSAVKHPDTADPNDKVSLINSAIELQLKVTDTDGDSSLKSVEIGKFIGFKDDGPTLESGKVDLDGFVIGNAIVKEENLTSGSDPQDVALTVTKELPINYGADGAVNAENNTTGLTFSNTTALEALNLKSGTKALAYTVSADGHAITAKNADGKDIFSIALSVDTAGVPRYEFTLKGPLDHVLNPDGSASNIQLPFAITATDGDGDSVDLKFKVEVVDDTPASIVRELEVNEDESVQFSNADVTTTTTKVNDDGQPQHGKVTIADDGTITYKPNEDYRGSDSYTYTVTTDGGTYERTVNVTVKPVADAPLFADRDDGGVVVTPEDTKESLGLKLPEIKDKGATEHNDPGYLGSDYSELLGAITLTPSGAGYTAGAVLQTGSQMLTPQSGVITIVITDASGSDIAKPGYHVNGLPVKNEAAGVYYLTEEEYEAITVIPAEDRHENLDVEVSVTSYEVNSSGDQLGGISGATSTQTITVDVQAVTDPVGIKVKDGDAGTEVTVEISPDNKTANITFNEDTDFNLTNILALEDFKDMDGSETRYLGLKGLPDGTTISVAGADYVIGATGTPTVDFGGVIGSIPALTIAGTVNEFPDITITPPKDFSGDLTGVEVILAAQDSDSDSTNATPLLETDTVTINLHIKPVAGDVKIEGAEGLEDMPIAFLKNIKVTDESTATGTLGEVITEVAFTLPADWNHDTGANTWSNADDQTWTMGVPVDGTGWIGAWSGDTYTITFTDNALTEVQREAILEQFTVTPPAHSSKDIDLNVNVTSVDHSIIAGGQPSAPASQSGPLKVVVKPVAEEVGKDSDGANGNDVTINASHVYGGNGTEDLYFTLGADGGFNLGAGWSNEDGKDSAGNSTGTGFVGGNGSEDTYALFTPFKTLNNDARDTAPTDGELDGSSFQYTDGANVVHTLVFNGTAVKIPVQYLDTVQFKGPENFKGVVKIKVQAGTIDYDEDNGTPTDMAVSGESWLTNIVLQPLADQVTLTVNARITTDEDVPFALNIKPSSSDTSETFNVTIKDIPAGASVTYTHEGITYVIDSSFDASAINGLTVTPSASDGSFSLTMDDFKATNQPQITPPKDSNEEIKLKVEAASVDTLTYIDASGATVTTGNIATGGLIKSLDITVTVNGVPDEPVFVIDNTKVYEEGVLDKHELPGATDKNQVILSDLITQLASGETTADGSETVTLRISGLPEGFDLNGAGSSLGGTGETRLWVINQTQLGDVKIQLPVNYSGTVSFTAQPVVTENDNDSGMFASPENISFKVNPTPEATLNISSDFIEDTVGKIDFSAVHQNGDTDEFISAIQIKAIAGVTFYSDAAGTIELTAVGGYYEVSGAAVNSIYAKGLPNFSGTQPIEVQYKVTDTSADSTLSKETDWQSANHDLIIKAVTDEISAALNDITAAVGAGDSFNYDDGTKTATVTGTGTVTVKVDVKQSADVNAGNAKDIDGSEQLTHIEIAGVPSGVSVEGAIQIGLGQWLITTSGDTFTNSDTLSKNVVFNVTGYAGNIANAKITITSYTKDMGVDSATSAENIQKAEVDWNLIVNQAGPASNDLPDVALQEIKTVQTEDVTDGFALNTVVGGTLANGTGSGEYDITVTLRSKPGDETKFTDAAGNLLTRTEVIENGNPVVLWTQSINVATGDDADTKLSDLLSSIKVHAPEHANRNNLTDGKLPLDVTVSVHADGVSKQAEIGPQVDIEPVTDATTVTVQADPVGEGDDILLNITLDNQPDGTYSNITGSIVTVELGASDLVGDLLYAGGTPVTPTVPGGNIYEIGLVGGQPPQLIFRPDANQPHQTGSLTVNASVTATETGAALPVTSSGSGTLVIKASNSGFAGAITAEGTEQTQGQNEATQLIVTGQGLNDTDEFIDSAFINGLPPGFTVYYGPDATNVVLANNAGQGADGNNTWSIPVVSGAQALPGYIAVLPPKHWSGSLSDLTLTVMSGESGLTPTGSDINFSLNVAPVADGIELNPTLSFGKAGDIIDLNLNAAMKDPVAADASNAPDAHSERTTLKFSGFTDGEKMLFFIDGVEMAASRVVFDSVNETHTITGLTQAELDGLGFQHLGTGGVKDITVTASTQEVDSAGQPVGLPSADSIGTVQINVTDKLPTIGNDTLLWTGSLIDGRGGEDTIQLRFGESITSSDLATNLKNIEVLDLSVAGANTIGTAGLGLSIADVLDITDSRNELTIDGDGEDKVFLDSGWTNDGNNGSGYVAYTYTDASNSANNVTLNIAEHIIVD